MLASSIFHKSVIKSTYTLQIICLEIYHSEGYHSRHRVNLSIQLLWSVQLHPNGLTQLDVTHNISRPPCSKDAVDVKQSEHCVQALVTCTVTHAVRDMMCMESACEVRKLEDILLPASRSWHKSKTNSTPVNSRRHDATALATASFTIPAQRFSSFLVRQWPLSEVRERNLLERLPDECLSRCSRCVSACHTCSSLSDCEDIAEPSSWACCRSNCSCCCWPCFSWSRSSATLSSTSANRS